MDIDVLVFGIAKEIVGSGSVIMHMNSATTVAALKKELGIHYPQLGRLASFAIAVNGGYVADDTQLKQGDEVAVIPPVSGG